MVRGVCLFGCCLGFLGFLGSFGGFWFFLWCWCLFVVFGVFVFGVFVWWGLGWLVRLFL